MSSGRRGARSRPASLRIFQTVEAATWRLRSGRAAPASSARGRHASRHPHVLDSFDRECGENGADVARVDVELRGQIIHSDRADCHRTALHLAWKVLGRGRARPLGYRRRTCVAHTLARAAPRARRRDGSAVGPRRGAADRAGRGGRPSALRRRPRGGSAGRRRLAPRRAHPGLERDLRRGVRVAGVRVRPGRRGGASPRRCCCSPSPRSPGVRCTPAVATCPPRTPPTRST